MATGFGRRGEFMSRTRSVYRLPKSVVNQTEEEGTEYFVRGRRLSRCLFNSQISSSLALIDASVGRTEPDVSRFSVSEKGHTNLQLNQKKWNVVAHSDLLGSTIHHLVMDQASRTPDGIAVFDPHEGGEERYRSLTYRELCAQSTRLARTILQLKYRQREARAEASLSEPEISCVGVFLERSPRLVVAMLATLLAGCCYVPLDPTFPLDRLAWYSLDSGLDVLLTEVELEKHANSIVDAVHKELGPSERGQSISVATFDQCMNEREEGEKNLLEVVKKSGNTDCAYIIYTSGSTGKPKGVMLQHNSVVNFLTSMHKKPGMPGPGQTLVAVTTICFDIHVLEIWGTLTNGGSVAIVPKKTATNGKQLAKILEETCSTHFQATPSTFRILIEAGWRETPDKLRSLKLMCGGEPMPVSLATSMLCRCGSGGQLWNMYGPTETTVWSTVFQVTSELLNGEPSKIPVGFPIGNTTIYILDPETLTPLPNGEVGVIYIGGLGMARGYRNRPELTSEKWVEDPFIGELITREYPLMYCTGDLGLVDPETLRVECLGRADNQVKISGFRIELGEIEGVIDKHPAVKAEAVLAITGEDSEKKLVGYVVGNEPGVPFADIRKFLAEALPMYMVPVYWVELDSLPLLPNGKVNRNAFPAPVWEEAATAGLLLDDVAVAEPKTQLEEKLLSEVTKLIGVSCMGTNDNFFLLGGNSLFAVRLHAAISESSEPCIVEYVPSSFDVSDIFQNPTVSDLAQFMDPSDQESLESSCESESSKHVKVVIPLQPRGDQPPVFFVHPAGGLVFPYFQLASKMVPYQPFYAIQDPRLDSATKIDTSLSLKDIAAEYIGYLKSVQSEGPYFIGGWSVGGNIAHEMGVQLLKQGDAVALVLLVDSLFEEEWSGKDLQKNLIKGLKAGLVGNALKLKKEEWKEKKRERENVGAASQLKITVGSALLSTLVKITPTWEEAPSTPHFLLGDTLDEELRPIAAKMYAQDTGVPVSDRWYRARLYHNCFIGKQAVEWMVAQGLAKNFEDAVRLGQQLMDSNVIKHVKGEHPFLNKHLFYRFVLDEQTHATRSNRLDTGRKLRRFWSSDTYQEESSESAEDILQTVEAQLKSHLEIKDRRYRLRKYKRCFVGREAVSLLVDTKVAKDRFSATELLSKLYSAGVFYHVTRDHLFEDDYLFYRFSEDLDSNSSESGSETSSTGPVSEGFEDVKSAQAKKLLKLLNWHMGAAVKHEPQFFDGRVTLLSCQHQPQSNSEPEKGWMDVCAALSVTHVAGNHYNVISEPYVSELAVAIKACIQEAQESAIQTTTRV